MALVFVYGTLKKGRGNHSILGDATFIGKGVTVEDSYTMYNGGYPMVTSDGKFHVSGELYDVDNPKTLKNLDLLEGHPNFFRRTDVSVRVNSDTFDAFMYTVPRHYTETRAQVQPNDANVVEW